jgi:hypothetical protein
MEKRRPHSYQIIDNDEYITDGVCMFVNDGADVLGWETGCRISENYDAREKWSEGAISRIGNAFYGMLVGETGIIATKEWRYTGSYDFDNVNIPVVIANNDNLDVKFDWVFIRKYTSPEPTVTIYDSGGGGGCGRITNWKTMCQGVYSAGQKVGAEMEFESLMGGGYNFKGVIVIRSPTGDEYTNSEEEWVPSAPNPQGKFAASDALYVTIPEGASTGNYDMKLELWNDDTDELCDATEWKEDLFFVGQEDTDAVLIMHFDEGFGTVAKDSSGNGNGGTIYGAAWTTGVSGKALSFDGDGDYVEITPQSDVSAIGDFTISAWTYLKDWKSQITSNKDRMI